MNFLINGGLMIMRMLMVLLVTVLLATPVVAVQFDQNVTPDVIFGSGNANGSFTTDVQDLGSYVIELGLRGKLRYNSAGNPENTFYSNGDGKYIFENVVAPGQPSHTPVWNFEWAVNVDQQSAPGAPGTTLDQLTYQLELDFDPSPAVSGMPGYDPVYPFTSFLAPDNALGDNSFANGTGVETSSYSVYTNWMTLYNVAQNSHNYAQYQLFGYQIDPTVPGVFDISLVAFDGGVEVSRTTIQIITMENPVSTEASLWGELKALYR